jgi:hypothetical protein
MSDRLPMSLTRFLLIVALLLIPAPRFYASDQTAEFNRIAAAMSRANVLRARFVQTKTIPALTRPVVMTGRFVYARGTGVIWNIERPYPVRYLLDERGVTEISKDGTALPRAGAGEMQHVGRILRALLEPDLEVLSRYFVPTVEGTAARWSLTLLPRPVLRQAFKDVRVRGARFVEQVVLNEANGDVTVIEFRQTQEAAVLGEPERRALSLE